MLLYRPAFIWDDASFQLSFLAVVGITELSPLLKRLLKLVPETLGLKETLVATLAAQIATIPLTVFIFRQLSLVAPFSNILVAPLVPAAMLLGFIGMVLGAIYWPLGLAVSYPAWAFLEAIILIANWSSAIPFAAIKF
jgi:competence protein ComEC